jgi:hypothetical protein
LPLSEVVKDLKQEAARRDPKKRGINFLINPSSREAGSPGVDPTTGAPLPPQPIDIGSAIVRINLPLKDVRLLDMLDVIKKVAEPPIRYSIEEYGVVFSSAPAQPFGQMISRTFKVDADTLAQGLANVAGLAVNQASPRGQTQSQQLSDLLRQFLASAGVTIESPNQVFYNDRTGILMIRVSDQEHDIVQAAVEMLSGEKTVSNSPAPTAPSLGRPRAEVEPNNDTYRFSVREQLGARLPDAKSAAAESDTIPLPRPVVVIGKVMKAGPIRLPEQEKIDIVQALALAGGFQPTANQNKIEFSRNGQTTKYRFRDLKNSDESKRLWLEPGDMIEVKESVF